MKFYYDAGTQQPGAGQYTTGWGNLVGYTLPSDPVKEPEATPWNGSSDTRAKVEFAYTTDDSNPTSLTPDDFTTFLRVKSKTLAYRRGHDGSVATDTWTYNINELAGVSSVAGPGGSGVSESFFPSYSGSLAGMVYKTVNADGSVVERLWAGTPIHPQYNYGIYNPFVKTEFVSIPNAAGILVLTAIKDYVYDQNGNVRFAMDYDFVPYASVPRDAQGRPTGIPSGLTPVRTSETNYHLAAPLTTGGSFNPASNFYGHPNAPGVIRAPINSTLRIGGQTGTIIGYSETGYDNPLTTANPISNRSWDSTAGARTVPLTLENSVGVQTQYDSFGNPTLITEIATRGTVTRNIQTAIEYGPVGNVTGLYPTVKRSAFNTSIQRNSTTAYDFATGLAMWTRDDDNWVMNTMDYDAAGRPTGETIAVGTPQQAKTTTQYFDADRYVVTKSDIGTFGDGRSVSIAHFDQLGRTWLTRTLEDPNQNPSDITLGVKVQTRWENETGTGANGSRMLVSNHYRAATPTAATNEPGMGWSLSRTDKAGRVLWVQTFAGAALPAPWGANSNSTGSVTTTYDANAVTVTDQAGKVRRSIKDGLGRLLRVDEPNANNQLGTVAAPNQATSYTYDIRDNLLQVNQGVQTRSFVYDSLSRLTSATAPESGTTSYTYDAGGNLATKTDARGVVVTNTYDALNRVTQRSYALTANVGATSTAQYFYDGAGLTGVTPNFAKGKLTKVTNGSASYEYRNFDALGRVLSARQIIDGNNYDTSYSYNLAGALITETYPSGRTVTNAYNADGSLNTVSGRAPGRAVRVYASNFEYAAHGAATKFQYGSGLWEETAFNSRLQVTGLTLRKQANTLWNVAYDYGTTDNNGNVKSQSILHPGITQPLVQTYSYDSLNRLTQVVENHNAIEQWKQTFSYDRYGNRTVVANQTKAEMVGPNPVINPANNRIVQQQGEGYAFDTAGNMTFDKDGRKFVFDGENKVVSFFASQSNQTPTAEYRYDADGKRVKKIVGNVTTLFVYDATGKMIAEYAINAPQPEPRTQYLTGDTLSSQRVISDGQGVVTSRRDFAPFGEELPGNTTNRQASQGYASANDKTKQKFATYERDDESGLDFAQARFYSDSLGRYFSSDPLLDSARLLEGDSWNRYIYVSNNPIRYNDSKGEQKQGIENSQSQKLSERFKPDSRKVGPITSGNRNLVGEGSTAGKILLQNGETINAAKIKSSIDGSSITNCHGYSLTGGELVIGNSEIPKLLAGEGFQEVTQEVMAGDLAVYYSESGDVLHSALVSATEGGRPTRVTGFRNELGEAGQVVESNAGVGPDGNYPPVENPSPSDPNAHHVKYFRKPQESSATRSNPQPERMKDN
jgi:RHS repeat-associated protein